jgi:hypothetical protein
MSTAKTQVKPTPRLVDKDSPPVIEQPDTKPLTVPWRRIGLYAVLAVAFFLLGAVPMWMRARENATQRNAAQHQLQVSELLNSLSSAVIDARRGEYELARQTTSDFFTELRKRIDAPLEQKVLSQSQRNALLPLLKDRDDLITLLARSDPAAADRLTTLYVNYRNAMRT